MPAKQDGASPVPGSGVRRLYLLRHGEAAPVARDSAVADPWLAQLTPRGRAQIAELAESLAGCGLDLLVTSVVPRARETAAILAGRTGLRPVAEEGLNELQPGSALAGSPEEVRQAIRRAYREAGLPGARFLGGESFVAFGQRVERAVGRVLAQPGWTRAVLVTHEPAVRLVLARSQGLGLAGLAAFDVAPGRVSVLDCPPGAATVEATTLRLANGTGGDALRLG
jgi:broad specificity phosphatase PhoE